MEYLYKLNKEAYVSPESEVILLEMAATILSNEGVDEGGNHDWPDPNNP